MGVQYGDVLYYHYCGDIQIGNSFKIYLLGIFLSFICVFDRYIYSLSMVDKLLFGYGDSIYSIDILFFWIMLFLGVIWCMFDIICGWDDLIVRLS